MGTNLSLPASHLCFRGPVFFGGNRARAHGTDIHRPKMNVKANEQTSQAKTCWPNPSRNHSNLGTEYEQQVQTTGYGTRLLARSAVEYRSPDLQKQNRRLGANPLASPRSGASGYRTLRGAGIVWTPRSSREVAVNKEEDPPELCQQLVAISRHDHYGGPLLPCQGRLNRVNL